MKSSSPAVQVSASKALTGIFTLVTPFAFAFAQTTPPPTPTAITAPAGNVLYLTTRGEGTQNYVCLPSPNNQPATWSFSGPQATLTAPISDEFLAQVATHFQSTVPNTAVVATPGCMVSDNGTQLHCPTWEGSLDSSRVWGSRVASITAGTDLSCPEGGAIPCLLLRAVATTPPTTLTGSANPSANQGQGPGGKIDSLEDGAGRGPLASRQGVFTRTTYIQRLNTHGGAAPVTSCTVGDTAFVPYAADYLFYRSETPAVR